MTQGLYRVARSRVHVTPAAKAYGLSRLCILGLVMATNSACGPSAAAEGEEGESTRGESTGMGSPMANSSAAGAEATTSAEPQGDIAAATDDNSRESSGTTEVASLGGTTDGPPPACGDGNLDPGEDCDDGNLSDDDACTSACVEAFCGDGLTWFAQEECDDGNAVDDDGCTNACVERFPEVFVRAGASDDVMWRYLPETDTYVELAGPGTLGLATEFYGMDYDGQQLWLVGYDLGLFRYDVATDSWTVDVVDGGFGDSQGVISAVWTPHGVFAFEIFWQAGDDYAVYRDGSWEPVLVDYDVDRAADYDPVTGELFVRVESSIEIKVIDAETDVLLRELNLDPTSVNYDNYSRDAAFVDGEVIVERTGMSMVRIDVQTGAITDTGLIPKSFGVDFAADVHKRHVYMAGSYAQAGTLQRYEIDAGAIVPLADYAAPGFVVDRGYLAVGYAEP